MLILRLPLADLPLHLPPDSHAPAKPPPSTFTHQHDTMTQSLLVTAAQTHHGTALQERRRRAAWQSASHSRLARNSICSFVSTLLFSISLSASRVAADCWRSQPIILSSFRFFRARRCSPQRLKCSTFAATRAEGLCKAMEGVVRMLTTSTWSELCTEGVWFQTGPIPSFLHPSNSCSLTKHRPLPMSALPGHLCHGGNPHVWVPALVQEASPGVVAELTLSEQLP